MPALKPQDVAVVLDLCRHGLPRPAYSKIAAEVAMSASEVHAAVKRAQASRLIDVTGRPNLSAIEEFLFHGLKYVFPPVRGEMTRGVLTSYAAPPLRELMVENNEPPPVWPYAAGKARGISFEPLYAQAAKAAVRDPELYELLALADALREGRARERRIAEDLMLRRIRSVVHA
jgi:hypothetical protein